MIKGQVDMVIKTRCDPKEFDLLFSGDKTFVVGNKLSVIRVGDYLAINEFVPDSEDPYDDMLKTPISNDERYDHDGRYSGKCLIFKITYIMDDSSICKEGFIILGLRYVLGREQNA